MNKVKPSSQLFRKIWPEPFDEDFTLFERSIGKQLKSLKVVQ